MYYRLSNVKVNENTAHILVDQTFNEKFSYFRIENIDGVPFDCIKFLNFCKANIHISIV